MKTLDLVLKHKWYDMIACGEKKEEYRAIKPYWIKRLLYRFQNDECVVDYKESDNAIMMRCRWFGPRHTLVRFHRGYTNTTMTFFIKDIEIGVGNPHWGAPAEEVFIIKLGERL